MEFREDLLERTVSVAKMDSFDRRGMVSRVWVSMEVEPAKQSRAGEGNERN